MAIIKSGSERPELSIAEAAEQLHWAEADLIYYAAEGKLTFYILANKWVADRIYEINNSKEDSNIKIAFTGPLPPPVPSSKDSEEFEREYQAWEKGKDCQDMTCGNKTYYAKNGAYRDLYKLTLSGYQPIAKHTFFKYRDGTTSENIEILFNEKLNLTKNVVEYYFCPTPEILLIDAINDGKLFVKKADLQTLASNNSLHPDDVKPKDGVHRNTLLKIIIGMAIDEYGYDHTAEKSPFPTELQGILDLQGIKCSDDTIRKALKEAAAFLPANPQKS